MAARVAWLRASIVLAVVVAVDQGVKLWVTAALERGERRDLVPLVDLVNGRNTGVAFGLLQDSAWLVGIAVGLAVAALLVFFARNAHRPALWLPVGMLLGGAVGNLVDRVREGAVIDFLKLPAWPAFNVADAAITVGVVVLFVVVELNARAEQRAGDDGAPGPA
ncbi:MAG: signal peptidase II [Solirubrobacteraceae bacterium MAG38_C4-C5]|nr:signal peptidase II [Candidatus Siliceabacter maunaloa]